MPPEPPTRGCAPGPRWGTSVPQTSCAPTSKSWLRHWAVRPRWSVGGLICGFLLVFYGNNSRKMYHRFYLAGRGQTDTYRVAKNGATDP